jgi:hypothetical protein
MPCVVSTMVTLMILTAKNGQKTWTERLKETQELARQREDQLKLLGLVTNADDLKAQSATVRFTFLSSSFQVHLDAHTTVVILLP